MKNIQAIRGMNDYLPNDTSTWQFIEDILKQVLETYGYNEIRLPIIENTALFKRAIGKLNDVVEKEMYTFEDRNGDSLTLRPEGTAGCIRACIEHSLLRNQEQRLWYIGPMFRYERPQKGRYRQFIQLGVEVFGFQDPYIEAELIMINVRWWKILGIMKYISLELNSIGSIDSRIRYHNALIAFFKKHEKELDEDCKRRMYKNPLRILDSKNPNIQILLKKAPMLDNYLDNDSYEHFNKLCHLLKKANISYTINQKLVRGLDYYNRTVFEWVTENLGSQGTICAGGRYDGLVKCLGGFSIPAVGFAIGLERLILLVKLTNLKIKSVSIIDVYLITLGEDAKITAMLLAERIRDALPKIRLKTNYSFSNIRKQFSRAKKLGARIVLMLGKSEVTSGKVIIKDLRSSKQITIMQNDVITYLRSLIF